VRRATDAERERLHETFASLCRIESPSGRERGVADWVTNELRGLGLEVEEDAVGPEVGSDAGNLLARIPGAGEDSILLCAHMDTVPLTAPVEPVRVDGGWTNAGEGILGADNKTAAAVMIELARRLTSGPGAGASPVGVELVFTVCEEISLLGARAFDVSLLRSRYGYVFDHATPIGEIVLAARRFTGSSPSSTAGLLTPGSDPRTDAARSRPPRARSRPCAWDGSTPTRPPMSGRSGAARRST